MTNFQNITMFLFLSLRSLLLVNFTMVISISVLRFPDWGRFVLQHVFEPAVLFASSPRFNFAYTHGTYTHYVTSPHIKGCPENQLQPLKNVHDTVWQDESWSCVRRRAYKNMINPPPAFNGATAAAVKATIAEVIKWCFFYTTWLQWKER